MRVYERTAVRLVALVLILAFPAAASLADAPRSWNHDSNAALLSVRNRGLIELGVSPEIGIGNNYFAIDDIFTPTITVDLSAIHQELGDNDLRLANSLSGEAHLVASLFGLSVGLYSNVDGTVSAGVPSTLFDVLGSGNASGENLSSTSPIVGRVFADAGIYGGLRWKENWYIGGKLGAYAPILYTDADSAVTFSLATYEAGDEKPDGTISAGEMNASADLSLTAYSAFNFNQPSIYGPSDLMAYLTGVKIDLGVIHTDGRKPVFGVNVSSIPIVPALATNAVSLNASASVTADNLLGNFDQGDAAFLTQEISDVEPSYVTDVAKTIYMPLQIGGFYRLALPVIDIIGHGQLYIGDPFQVTAGAMVEGNVFPLNIFSAGVEYDRMAWRTTVGARLNLWIAELGVDLGVTAPNPFALFSGQGVWAKIYVAAGL